MRITGLVAGNFLFGIHVVNQLKNCHGSSVPQTGSGTDNPGVAALPISILLLYFLKQLCHHILTLDIGQCLTSGVQITALGQRYHFISHTAGFFIRDEENEMDGRRFFGFYELQNRKKECVAEWNNMKLASQNGKKAAAKKAPLKDSQVDPSDTQPVEVKHIVARSPEQQTDKNNSKNGDASSQEAAK